MASAQSGVVGRVIDPASRTGITEVRVSAHDGRGREIGVTLSDSIGHFRLSLGAGEYVLRVARIGYGPAETSTIEINEDEQLEVVLQMTIQPIGIEPLVVIGSRVMAGHLIGYYERLDRAGLRGRFITRAQIDSVDAPGITSYLEYYGLPMQVNRRGEKWPTGVGRCPMRVFVDDVTVDGFVIDAMVRPADVEGVEIYRNAFEAPPKYSARLNTCGVILIWTRMDRRDAIPFWRGVFILAGSVSALLFLRRLMSR